MFAVNSLVKPKAGELNDKDVRGIMECVDVMLFVPSVNSMLKVLCDEPVRGTECEDMCLASGRFLRQASD